jgi:hypothetical protein
MMPKLDLETLNERLERMSDLLDKLETTLDMSDLWHPGDDVAKVVVELKDEVKDLFDMVYESQLD